MFNPNPPAIPVATPDFWTPDEKYAGDVPFPVKEATRLTHKKHRYFQVFEIGSISGMGNNQQSVVPGLAVGASVTYNFDQIPDYYTVALSSETTARCFVYVGANATGIPLRISAGGVITIPSFGIPFLTVVCRAGTATAFGSVIGMAGYDELLGGKYTPQ